MHEQTYSEAYQIDLHICGVVRKVPQGSYMQVGFGFPEGYGPDDAGVTFTVYHYKRDNAGKITEVETVPCVITEYGIISTVKSFSPFTICAVKSDKATHTGKNIYASVDGAGGKVDNAEIRTVAQGESVTFEITADAGYGYDRVLLNGKDVKSKIANGKLTIKRNM